MNCSRPEGRDVVTTKQHKNQTPTLACPSPSVSSVVFGFLFGVEVFCLHVWWHRLERCQSTSRHGTCRYYAQSLRDSITTGATAVQLTQSAVVISEMEQAALNRMAKSIAQLTLCQVTGEEIATATKLLEKACQKLRGIPEVPPQRITDLDNPTRQHIKLVAFWIVARSQRAISQSSAESSLAAAPHRKKDLARLQKSIMPTGTHSRRCPFSFHLTSAFTPCFTFQCPVSRCDKTASCWLGSYP